MTAVPYTARWHREQAAAARLAAAAVDGDKRTVDVLLAAARSHERTAARLAPEARKPEARRPVTPARARRWVDLARSNGIPAHLDETADRITLTAVSPTGQVVALQWAVRPDGQWRLDRDASNIRPLAFLRWASTPPSPPIPSRDWTMGRCESLVTSTPVSSRTPSSHGLSTITPTGK